MWVRKFLGFKRKIFIHQNYDFGHSRKSDWIACQYVTVQQRSAQVWRVNGKTAGSQTLWFSHSYKVWTSCSHSLTLSNSLLLYVKEHLQISDRIPVCCRKFCETSSPLPPPRWKMLLRLVVPLLLSPRPHSHILISSIRTVQHKLDHGSWEESATSSMLFCSLEVIVRNRIAA